MPGSPRREALLVTEAAARQGPRGIDARVPSHTERRRGAGYDFFERERHGRKPPVRSTYPLSAHSTRIALMLYPSPMPVTSAVRFVSWAFCVRITCPTLECQRRSAGWQLDRAQRCPKLRSAVMTSRNAVWFISEKWCEPLCSGLTSTPSDTQMSPLVRCYSFLSLRFLSYLLAADSWSSQGASIVAHGLNSILDDKLEYAVAAAEENRCQAEPSQHGAGPASAPRFHKMRVVLPVLGEVYIIPAN